MKPITIVGGGLAGLTLGLGLRQRGAPVTVIEAGRYPRHRVCGEFISGDGRAALNNLKLEQRLFEAGGREAHDAAFFSRRAGGQPQALPCPALCLSRHALDQLLAQEFQNSGGILRQEERWTGPLAEGFVRATGRRPASASNTWRWFGLKVHARNVSLAADLEVHLTRHGYVGLCRLNLAEVNICGLFRSQTPVPDLMQNWRTWLSGAEGSALHKRLAAAEFLEDSFCSIAGLQPNPQLVFDPMECEVGDALTMIPPFTGNGMSMAFESAALMTPLLFSYSSGKIAWAEMCQMAAQECEMRFRRRLRWSSWLQKILFQEQAADALIRIGSKSPRLWRLLFERTR